MKIPFSGFPPWSLLSSKMLKLHTCQDSFQQMTAPGMDANPSFLEKHGAPISGHFGVRAHLWPSGT